MRSPGLRDRHNDQRIVGRLTHRFNQNSQSVFRRHRAGQDVTYDVGEISLRTRRAPGWVRAAATAACAVGAIAVYLAVENDGAAAQNRSAAPPAEHQTWRGYGGGPDSSKFMALGRITKANVGQLQVAGRIRLARVKTAPSVLTVGEDVRPGQRVPLGLDNAGFRRFHTPEFAKHLRSAGVPLDRATDNSAFDLLRVFENGQRRVAVAVLPEIWQRYDVSVPASVEGPFRLEVDLLVERVERFENMLVLYRIRAGRRPRCS